ncbi:methyltransferase domain-containing protein [Patescibacteria group bacterium]|nr:methyltransferase domain-containing protein [Patescibacteria group bacterium]MCG2702544.1 class I SAM-dependent methyltransferase [Candidatus Parcubacteria bacterium]MBU4265106.1 methyltransferase domain-containing protein [Patescibacteria group bacterium]MBU4390670.1 methyltransferase domain-containing protein [Patescibacteria group bacterium]MBU4397572.1 methyltransferase domain-containing protein [Patescibacteria group bacterium]
MKINVCRVCGQKFFDKSLLVYKNMPAVAQNFPDEKSLKSDMGIEMKVYQCSGCGLVQLSNEPVSYYKEVIRAVAFSPEMRNFRVKQFGDFVKKYSLKNKRVIEIGCGKGEYLSIMKQCGVSVYGLEQSTESVSRCVKDGLKVFQGFVKDSRYKIKNAPYDAFFILSFLEHLPDPNSVLGGICDNLSDNAVGIIEVPNFDMILKQNLFSEFTRDHLFYFTKDTLVRLLGLNGFDVIGCRVVWHEYIISAIVKKRARISVEHFYKKQEKLKLEISRYISRFKDNKVAIWGAGHQSLAVMAMLDLAGKIKYVVDSAPFKQGKYTPATHIPIVSPETLNLDPVAGLIVMAASYSDEVVSILRKRFDKNFSISVVRDYGLEIIR